MIESPAAAVIPLHTAIPGRLRVHVSSLRRDGRAIDRFVANLRRDRTIATVRVNPLTGNALVLYHGERPLADMLALLRLAAEGHAAAPENEPAWHALPADGVAALTGTDLDRGLTAGESRRRLARHGANRLPTTPRRRFAAILAGQFLSLPVALLAGSAVASLLTGGAFEAVAILVVVAANGLIGAVNEAQAERMIARLEGGQRRIAQVRRDGWSRLVDADTLVSGDLIDLTPGNFVPADARLIAGRDLSIDESILTGESLPVEKDATAELAEAQPLADRSTMVWRGTLVASGQGRAIVVATGPDTEVGRIQRLIGELAPPETPLQRKLNRLGRQLVIGAVGLCALLLAVGAARGFALAELLRTVFALGVAAIPEGLPTVATLSLAKAVGVLKTRGVLIRRLEAVETLGVVSTVFFDKTGTLTLNRMSVAEIAAEGDPGRLWRTAALCSDASVEREGEAAWRIDGSSTEAALIRAALDHGVDVPALRQARPRLAERYRDERRQSMATVHDLGGGRRLLAVKGSPPEVLAASSLTAERRQAVARDNEAMARRGLRVLAFACAEGEENSDLEAGGLQWLGLVGLADPVRPGAGAALARMRRLGLDCVMLTGDQAPTACSVAYDLGMVDGPDPAVADGIMVDALPADRLAEIGRATRVFARIQPRHKLKVVVAFQGDGRIVSMVGDGVNDGPALKAANIGITVGRQGSGAARDLADMVLENDDLAGLAAAVEQGRLTHANIRKSVDFLVATNLSEMLLMVTTTVLGMRGALNPLQLLWINLATDVFPGLALAHEPPEPSAQCSAGSPDSFLDRAEIQRIGAGAVTMAGTALAAFGWARRGGGDGLRASSVATASLVVSQMLHAYTSRSRRRGGGGPNPSLNLAVGATLGAHLAVQALPFARRLLGLSPLGPIDLAVAAASGLASYLLNEARKPKTDAAEAGEAARLTAPPGLAGGGPKDRLRQGHAGGHRPARDGVQKSR